MNPSRHFAGKYLEQLQAPSMLRCASTQARRRNVKRTGNQQFRKTPAAKAAALAEW